MRFFCWRSFLPTSIRSTRQTLFRTLRRALRRTFHIVAFSFSRLGERQDGPCRIAIVELDRERLTLVQIDSLTMIPPSDERIER